MNKSEVILQIEELAQALHQCIGRLKNASDKDVPAIEIGLLEHKVVAFYDRIQSYKYGLEEKKDTDEPNDVIEEIRTQFETIKNQFTETSEQLTATPEVEEVSTDAETDLAEVDEATNDEIEEVMAEAEQMINEDPPAPIKWEVSSAPEMEVVDSKASTTESNSENHHSETEADSPQEELTTETMVEESQIVEAESAEVPLEEVVDAASDEKPASLNERFSNQQKSLHERLSEQKEKQKVLSKQFSGKPIKDLKKAINLNMQIRFTKELFDNDKRAFKRTVDFINKCNTFSEARSYAQSEVLHKYEIAQDNKHYQELLGLVKRRFV